MTTGMRIFLIVAVQTIVLATMVGMKQWTLSTGTPILLDTEPIDPRSLFRGDYVILNYDISLLDLNTLEGDNEFQEHDSVYVVLMQGEKYWNPVSVYRKLPDATQDQVVIKGKVRLRSVAAFQRIQVSYGIENYFVPEGEGRKLEGLTSNQTLDIRVSVDRFGNAAIHTILVDGEEWYRETLFGKATLKNVIPKAKQEGVEDVEDLNEIERQNHIDTTPEKIQIGQELIFLKYAQDALSREDPESAYRLIEDGLISEYEEVREKSRQFIEQNTELYEGARSSFTFESLKESLRMYGEDARKLENQRLSIYKTVASAEDYSEARQSFVKVFGEID